MASRAILLPIPQNDSFARRDPPVPATRFGVPAIYFAGRDSAGVASLFAGAVIGHTADGALTNFGLAENCAVARTTAYGAERTLIAWAMSCS